MGATHSVRGCVHQVLPLAPGQVDHAQLAVAHGGRRAEGELDLRYSRGPREFTGGGLSNGPSSEGDHSEHD